MCEKKCRKKKKTSFEMRVCFIPSLAYKNISGYHRKMSNLTMPFFSALLVLMDITHARSRVHAHLKR